MHDTRTIWKFVFTAGPDLTATLPLDAKVAFTGVDPQTNRPAIWVELDPEAICTQRHFRICGTGFVVLGKGEEFSDVHVGSMIDGPFVWHVYEVRS